jgi:hypothetical protein
MNIIIAPHPDDELIGCFEVLQKKEPSIIIYGGDTDFKRKEETKNLRNSYDNIVGQLFLSSVPSNLMIPNNTLYFPDPIYETHPLHRFYGMQGEAYARNDMNIIFYTTNMQAPYIHEVKDVNDKEKYLNLTYPSQKSLWEHEKKYILFEGYCKWIF